MVPSIASNFARFISPFMMKKTLKIILMGGLFYLWVPILIGATSQDSTREDSISIDNNSVSEVLEKGDPVVNTSSHDHTSQLPLILNEAKDYFVETIIADSYHDTLEVLYLIDKIVDLLEGAEQLGEMSDEDQEEFDRFEKTFLHVYENYLETVDQIESPIAIASLKEELSAFLEPLELEINGSKFKVIDDREGHIPLISNKRVDQAIKFFQTKGRRNFEIWLSRYPIYKDLITNILTENELPEELIFLAMIESGLNPKAYSRAHAAGIWQFISPTARKYGLVRNWWIDERRDPVKSTQAASDYLKDLYLEFDDWYLAIAAYNTGAGRINRAMRLHQTRDFWRLNSLPTETKNYIPTFLAAAIITRHPEEYGFRIPKRTPQTFDKVILDRSADLTVLASCAGISVNELKWYNPDLRQFATPPDGYYTLKIPPGSREKFLEKFNSLPNGQRFAPQYMVHRVKKGENLWLIARKYHIPINDIVAVNKIRNYNRLQIGQKLTIPIPSLKTASPLIAFTSTEKDAVYVVKKGDTLSHIALKYGTTARKIRQLNGLRYGSYIFPGQKLAIPTRSYAESATKGEKLVKEIYTVKKGDTLGHIAMRYRTSASKIREWNGIRRGAYIHPGQKLIIYLQEG